MNHSSTNGSSLLTLRLIVLALGETSAPPWWRSKFMSGAGLRFLERLYPRTYFSAAVQAAGKAAAEVHDRAVGRGGVYHLFRLPEHLETEIRRGALVSRCGNRDILPDLDDFDRLLCRLEEIAGVPEEAMSGPIRIGRNADFDGPEVFRHLAALYLDAFRGGRHTYPYFEIGRESK